MNKINYDLLMQKEMEEIVESGKRPKLLLHACCAPCSSSVLERLKDVFEVIVYYYNPNIYPFEEYARRLEEEKRYLKKLGIQLIEEEYVHNSYLDCVKGNEKDKEKGNRCKLCYEMRMRKTCEKAKEIGAEYFTTTLSISPHKVISYIIEIGEKLESEYGVKFLRSDFKKREGYKRSLEISREEDFYRQDYCGCEFSIRNNFNE